MVDGKSSPIRSACFVLPTYNEAQNIVAIIRQILVLDHANLTVQILVVDDASPDGTADLVHALNDERVRVLSGQKRGLGSAYTRAFEYVLKHMSVDAVVQMDADFSHAPMDASRLLAQLASTDVAIGSRYVAGGSVDPAWGLRRRLISKVGNLFARSVAGIYRVRDCTAGFKAIRVEALRRAFPLRLRVQGYVFQVASLHALQISGASIAEVPIYFADRAAGETKLGRDDIIEFFVHVWWLRLLSRKTFIKFALTGLTGVAVNLVSFQLLLSTLTNPYVSSAIAIEISIVWNFMLNNFWTFRDRTMRTRKRVRGLKFNAVSLLTLVLSFSTFVLLRWFFPDHPAWFSQFISIFPAALANYFANSYWTFKSDQV
ncbi:MAG: glycosyltransferase family 2 protein [Pseudomonadales bacterium]|nr:glycosyltransferase family 2 protein [Pseudomonadales bacterium]